MLTSLEPPSTASSAVLREVERSLQTTPQLPAPPTMTSPPEPEKHRDAAESSSVTPVFKRLQTKFKKTNKIQVSQPPDQLSTKSGRPVNPLISQSQPTASVAKETPSRMATGQCMRVSVFFLGGQKMCGMSDEASQRAVARPVNWVRCSVCC